MAKQINIQGHRGARGLYPENTLMAFIEAVKLGVDKLEMDVVISADRQVIVSHEAWMNEDFCSLPDGTPVKKGTGKNYNLYKMNYADIRTYDCGQRGNARFPEQKADKAYKPLLSEVITTVESYVQQNNLLPVSYNIELKSEMEEEFFNPPPAVFIDLFDEVLKKYKIKEWVNVQSFDTSLLQEMRKRDNYIKIGLLIENQDSLDTNLKRLGFMPCTYSPEFILVDKALVDRVHHLGMKLIPWTVNEMAKMEELMRMGVDGIITDYPDRAMRLIKNYNN